MASVKSWPAYTPVEKPIDWVGHGLQPQPSLHDNIESTILSERKTSRQKPSLRDESRSIDGVLAKTCGIMSSHPRTDDYLHYALDWMRRDPALGQLKPTRATIFAYKTVDIVEAILRDDDYHTCLVRMPLVASDQRTVGPVQAVFASMTSTVEAAHGHIDSAQVLRLDDIKRAAERLKRAAFNTMSASGGAVAVAMPEQKGPAQPLEVLPFRVPTTENHCLNGELLPTSFVPAKTLGDHLAQSFRERGWHGDLFFVHRCVSISGPYQYLVCWRNGAYHETFEFDPAQHDIEKVEGFLRGRRHLKVAAVDIQELPSETLI